MRDNKGNETPGKYILNILQNVSYDLFIFSGKSLHSTVFHTH